MVALKKKVILKSLKKKLIYLKELQREKRKDTLWFTAQMDVMAGSGSGQIQELLLGFPCGGRGQTLVPSSTAFPDS